MLIVDDNHRGLQDNDVETLNQSAHGIQLSARIVDTPCNEMHTDGFIQEVQVVGQALGITPLVIQGEELDQKGFGGIYGVGKAAIHQPALAVLSHTPEGATETVAWVGKGIVYDTGGLSIKVQNCAKRSHLFIKVMQLLIFALEDHIIVKVSWCFLILR